MRTIKFRGKSIDGELPNGEELYGNFVYGNLLLHKNGVYRILVPIDGGFENYKVAPHTVGQFTCLYDKNRNEIYEGDILRFGNSPSGVCEVKWNKRIMAFCVRFYFECNLGSRPLGEWMMCERSVEIIGNVHDNPELLKGVKQ